MIPEAFRSELVALINKHSVEQCGDIPDYILAQHICDHIDVLHRTLKVRDKWFGVEHRLPMSGAGPTIAYTSTTDQSKI